MSLRESILLVLSKYCSTVILIDYLIPQPKNLWRLLNVAVEYFAGKEHFANFKSYSQNDGIKGLMELTGLKIEDEIVNSPSTSHIAIVKN